MNPLIARAMSLIATLLYPRPFICYHLVYAFFCSLLFLLQVSIYPTPPRARCDIRSILSKIKLIWISFPSPIFVALSRRKGQPALLFTHIMPFPSILAQSDTQTDSSRIWTRISLFRCLRRWTLCKVRLLLQVSRTWSTSHIFLCFVLFFVFVFWFLFVWLVFGLGFYWGGLNHSSQHFLLFVYLFSICPLPAIFLYLFIHVVICTCIFYLFSGVCNVALCVFLFLFLNLFFYSSYLHIFSCLIHVCKYPSICPFFFFLLSFFLLFSIIPVVTLDVTFCSSTVLFHFLPVETRRMM